MATQDRLTLRNLYLYLVCLITLVIAIFATVSLVRGTVELLYPDPGYYGYYKPDVTGGNSTVTEQERLRAEQASRDSQRRNAVLGLVGAGAFLIVSVPVYLYHWRRVQEELPSRATPTGEPPTS